MCVATAVAVFRRASGIPPCPAAPFTAATLLCALVTASAAATWLELTKRCSTGSYMIDDCRVVLAGRTLETGAGAEVLGIVPATRASAGACLITDTFSPFEIAIGDALTCPETGYTPCAMLIGVLPFLSSGCAGTNPRVLPAFTQTAVTGRYGSGRPPTPAKPLGVHTQPHPGANNHPP